MAKLYFSYSAMNAGKSTILLQASHNYQERGMQTLLLTAKLDTRAGPGVIASRIGLSADAFTFREDTDLFSLIKKSDFENKRFNRKPTDSQLLGEQDQAADGLPAELHSLPRRVAHAPHRRALHRAGRELRPTWR